MKFETLAYHAAPFEGLATAPARLGRHNTPQAALPLGSILGSARQLWLWMSFQLIIFLSKCRPAMCEASPQRLVLRIAGESTSEPTQIVRMTRALLRRLDYLMRRGRVGGAELEVYDPSEEQAPLTPGQFVQRLIRLRQWSRVKALRLGQSKAEKIKASRRRSYIFTDGQSQMCQAPLSPD